MNKLAGVDNPSFQPVKKLKPGKLASLPVGKKLFAGSTNISVHAETHQGRPGVASATPSGLISPGAQALAPRYPYATVPAA